MKKNTKKKKENHTLRKVSFCSTCVTTDYLTTYSVRCIAQLAKNAKKVNEITQN